jgi:hypothetical protein
MQLWYNRPRAAAFTPNLIGIRYATEFQHLIGTGNPPRKAPNRPSHLTK